jgi:hypothetical protein
MMRRVNEASTAARAKEGELLKKCGKLGLSSSLLRGSQFLNILHNSFSHDKFLPLQLSHCPHSSDFFFPFSIHFFSLSICTKVFIYGGNDRTRKGDARSSAAARSRSEYTPENGESVWGAEAQNGDVVEYPLSDAIKAQHQDDRLKGNDSLVIHFFYVVLLCAPEFSLCFSPFTRLNADLLRFYYISSM